MKNKTLVSAGIVREFIFSSELAWQRYVRSMRGDCEVIKIDRLQSGKVHAIVCCAYNGSPLFNFGSVIGG